MLNPFARRSPLCEFGVASGALRVTDPGYAPDVWCAGQLDGVRNGRWLAQVGYYHCPDDRAAIEQYRQHDRARIASAIAEQEQVGEGNFAAITIMQGLRRELATLEARWKEFDETDPGRVAYLRVCHESQRDVIEQEVLDVTGFELADITVGVDSAKVGFFDLAPYRAVYASAVDQPSDASSAARTFQLNIEQLIEANHLFGVVGFGAVSSTGYGDGMYPCFTRVDGGDIVDARIVFIDPEDVPAS